jgi:hypothetical protein
MAAPGRVAAPPCLLRLRRSCGCARPANRARPVAAPVQWLRPTLRHRADMTWYSESIEDRPRVKRGPAFTSTGRLTLSPTWLDAVCHGVRRRVRQG